MSVRTFAVGLVALVWAVAAPAQQRGTVEFGAFGSAASFDNTLSLETAYGGGGRVGIFLDPRWSLEFEKAEMRASRPNGLASVNVGILSARLAAVPLGMGAISFVVGAGAGVSTETNFLHSYGVDALVGAKLALHENVALRADGVWDWLANEDWKSYRSLRLGLVLYRHPNRATHTVAMITPPGPMVTMTEDSVSATEMRRLRDRDAELRTLRDSLRRVPMRTVPTTSAATAATMEAQLHFAFDKSELTDSAKVLLDEKIAVFHANREMTIVVRGYTDVTGTDAYNMSLGRRRAQAATDYIVARGIAASRVIVETAGERQQIPNSAGVDGEAPNRRAIFRLLIAPDVINKK